MIIFFIKPMPNTANRQLDCSRVAVISTFLIMVLITLFQFNKDNVVMQSIESSQHIGYSRASKEEEEGELECLTSWRHTDMLSAFQHFQHFADD